MLDREQSHNDSMLGAYLSVTTPRLPRPQPPMQLVHETALHLSEDIARCSEGSTELGGEACLSGYSCFRRLNSSSIVSRGLSLMSSIFSHPITFT